MITRDQAYDIICGINEAAHERSWDTWCEADDLADSDDEDDWERAEDLRDQASAQQARYFREEFDNLDDDTKQHILHYVNIDNDFRDELVVWYGQDDWEADYA